MTAAYYNENDSFAAEWLRKLILFGAIAPGDVDERSIEDVNPDDLRGYQQCHFFAGIGVWSYALRQAGWADDRPIWTGSCPCQPFSAAGKRKGAADERHLWPAFFHLIGERRPSVVVGEQVASKDGMAWLDLVSADMEGSGYAFGAVDLCAAGFGAPHIRQRNYFVAIAEGLHDAAGARQFTARIGTESEARNKARLRGPERGRRADGLEHDAGNGWIERRAEPGERRAFGGRGLGGLADDDDERREGRHGVPERPAECAFGTGVVAGGLADDNGGQSGDGALQRSGQQRQQQEDRGATVRLERTGPVNGYWRDADWLFCRDARWRPVEAGTFPLAHGVARRVGLLRGFGNAVVAPVAQGFIEAVMECIPA